MASGSTIPTRTPAPAADSKGAAVAFVDLQELNVRADVSHLPERIVVNVEGLVDGTKILAKDIEMPQDAELATDGEESVVTVEVPEDATESTAPAPEPVATPADAADASAAETAPAADAE